MAKIKFYTAASLDGYLAGPNEEIDWLFHDQDYGYSAFISSIGSLMMGRKTYDQILQFGDWPYPDKPAFVFTHHPPASKPHPLIEFIPQGIPEFVRNWKETAQEDIWLIGGGEIFRIFLQEQLVDELILSIHPVLLGGGISLFHPTQQRSILKLINSRSFASGLVQLEYAFLR